MSRGVCNNNDGGGDSTYALYAVTVDTYSFAMMCLSDLVYPSCVCGEGNTHV